MFLINHYIKEAFFDIRRHKTRYFLISIGIIWGTMTVSFLLALRNGFLEKEKKDIFLNLGAPHVLYFFPHATSQLYRGFSSGRTIIPKMYDITRLPQAIPFIDQYSVLYSQSNVPLVYKTSIFYGSIQGVNASFFYLAGIQKGNNSSFFTKDMVAQRMRVIVLNSSLKDNMFSNKNPVGQSLNVSGYTFHIIGYQKTTVHNYFNEQQAYIPYTTYLSLFGNHGLQAIVINALSNNVDLLSKLFYRYFAKRYQFSPSDESSFYKWDIGNIRQFFSRFIFIISLFLIGCSFLCLLVGGLGVCSSMFLVVRERCFEIGLKMALGAQPSMILKQFLIQSILVVCLAGGVGLVFSEILIFLLNTSPKIVNAIGSPKISFLDILSVMGVLIFVGILSGWLPAVQASRTKIVETLQS